MTFCSPSTQQARAGHGWFRLAYCGFLASGALFALTYLRAWRGETGGMFALFWAGVAAAVVSTCVIAWQRPGRWECFSTSLVIGAVFFLPKIFRSPDVFNFFDELAHLRATERLGAGGGLFLVNPINRVVEFYPGLEAATGTVASLTGMSVFAAGNVLIGVAHVVLAGALYLVFERFFHSPSRSLIAVLIYAANPAFFYFDSYFAYESLALPLTAIVLACAVSVERLPSGKSRALLASTVLMIGAIVVTHHASSYMLAVILGVFALSARLLRHGRETVLAYAVLFAATSVLALIWLLSVAPYTLRYLSPYVTGNVTALFGFVSGTAGFRKLNLGSQEPRYEIWAGYASVVILLLMFGIGIARSISRRLLSREHGLLAFIVLGGLYFLSLPVVLTRADQTVERVWEFAFIGLAGIVALAFGEILLRGHALVRAVAVAAIIVTFVGGVTSRTGVELRFPGPWAPTADPRSMTGDVFAAADWLRVHRGPNNVVVGDRTIKAVFSSYGQQDAPSNEGPAQLWKIFFPLRVNRTVVHELEFVGAKYVVGDDRITTQVPRLGWYFSPHEPGAATRTKPLDLAALEKFDRSLLFARIYDNGHISIYRYLSHPAA